MSHIRMSEPPKDHLRDSPAGNSFYSRYGRFILIAQAVAGLGCFFAGGAGFFLDGPVNWWLIIGGSCIIASMAWADPWQAAEDAPPPAPAAPATNLQNQNSHGVEQIGSSALSDSPPQPRDQPDAAGLRIPRKTRAWIFVLSLLPWIILLPKYWPEYPLLYEAPLVFGVYLGFSTGLLFQGNIWGSACDRAREIVNVEVVRHIYAYVFAFCVLPGAFMSLLYAIGYYSCCLFSVNLRSMWTVDGWWLHLGFGIPFGLGGGFIVGRMVRMIVFAACFAASSKQARATSSIIAPSEGKRGEQNIQAEGPIKGIS